MKIKLKRRRTKKVIKTAIKIAESNPTFRNRIDNAINANMSRNEAKTSGKATVRKSTIYCW